MKISYIFTIITGIFSAIFIIGCTFNFNVEASSAAGAEEGHVSQAQAVDETTKNDVSPPNIDEVTPKLFK